MGENFDLSCSLVLYGTSPVLVEKILSILYSSNLKIRIYLIDNSPTDALKVYAQKKDVQYYFNNKNIGYGAGHNIAIRDLILHSPYHLVINADVDFKPEILSEAFLFMENNKDVGLLSPKIFYPDGTEQIMRTRIPTPFDLFLARRLPQFLKRFFRKKIARYFLYDVNLAKPKNVPNLPGSFMFFRSSALEKVNGFDERFFMYVEDVDLTRRIHRYFKTIYYPYIEIVHTLERGSIKFSKLFIYHLKSAVYYFNKWGWFFDKERDKINRQIN